MNATDDAGGHGAPSPTERELRFRMTYSRLLGSLFLAGFLSYGVGSGIVDSIVGDADAVTTIPDRETLLAFGALLMLLNTGVDIGKGVLFFPVLEGYSKRIALVYLSALIAQVVLMDIGVLLVLTLVPLAQLAVEAGGATPDWIAGLGSLLPDANTIAYNMGQAVLSFGGVFLCWLLLRTGLIPRWLAALGLAGYVLHGVGSVAELYGIGIGLFLLIPGGIFEVVLAFWLLIKGFDREAYARGFRLEERLV
ncbi:MAG: DUF4386 domain-containing protein [Thermoleophilia bacterium]|nr:DUF4386 domain-containing protein [Thermoleophilia bacterium]